MQTGSSGSRQKADIHELLNAIQEANCEVEYWDGERRTYGTGRPEVLVRLREPGVVPKILADLLIELPEAYVNHEIDIEGDLQALLRMCYRIDPRRLRLGLGQQARLALNAIQQRNTRNGGSRRNVQHHYDLGNEFFRLWLDEQMVYSCAYYEDAGASLETAQRRKLEHICSKLELSPGQTLLDIGCGWGALASHAARECGADVLGITLSQGQHDVCLTRAAEPGVAGRMQVRLQDYRELNGAVFDRVVSVGMMEHVGKDFLSDYIAVLARCLRPGGVGVLQWISKNEPTELTPWILLRIFPGMYLPTIEEVAALLPVHGLRLLDAENLRPHYALTLDAWAARFEAHADEVTRMLGPQFTRMWRMYLHAASVAFKVGDLNLWQIRFASGLADDVPLTRRHWYVPAQA